MPHMIVTTANKQGPLFLASLMDIHLKLVQILTYNENGANKRKVGPMIN
jgi:hypothetical protein